MTGTAVADTLVVAAIARSARARGFAVLLPSDAHGTYDLDDSAASRVARVVEHALGDVEPALTARSGSPWAIVGTGGGR